MKGTKGEAITSFSHNAGEAAAPPAVSPSDVLAWARHAGWDNDNVLVKLDVRYIADICNWQRKLGLEREAGEHKVDQVRCVTRRARNLAASLRSEVQSLINEMDGWTGWQQHAGGLEELRHFLDTFDAAWRTAAPNLAPSLPSGGQETTMGEFIAKLDRHLCSVLALNKLSATPSSPYVRFILAAVVSVLGDNAFKTYKKAKGAAASVASVGAAAFKRQKHVEDPAEVEERRAAAVAKTIERQRRSKRAEAELTKVARENAKRWLAGYRGGEGAP